MQKHLKSAVVAAGLIWAAAGAGAQEGTDVNRVVATVNGTDITLGHMIETMTELPAQYRQLPDDVLFPAILDQLVQQTLLSNIAAGPLPARVAITLANEERSLRAGVAIAQIIASDITEDDVAEAYAEIYAGQDMGLEYNASHILVETEAEAADLLAELQAGADFATAAQQHSTGPSGPSGGALGWFQRGQMVEPFDNAVAAMDVGALAGPVQTQFGWHLIKLNETRQIQAPPLEAVREDILDTLGQLALEKRLAELEESEEITRQPLDGIDPAILRDVSLLEN